jgi:hypothetical protein
MTNETIKDRPGEIKEMVFWGKFIVRCDLCTWNTHAPSYQEASIKLTGHLDMFHKGWDKEAA